MTADGFQSAHDHEQQRRQPSFSGITLSDEDPTGRENRGRLASRDDLADRPFFTGDGARPIRCARRLVVRPDPGACPPIDMTSLSSFSRAARARFRISPPALHRPRASADPPGPARRRVAAGVSPAIRRVVARGVSSAQSGGAQ
ncbi:hypothetical protein [Burkholderia sp. ABCPW 14]|uniref:hypothetical protein n=1 Tax=Burkholderia sp. ABCPW 14 TaxID=1637860 RepID=UPI001E49960B|nr:hypothetical protein [Burkholderia sp. ABCPW 14]